MASLLLNALTAALNKISGENRERVITAICQEIVIESESDAQLIVRTLYHRAIHDGCFYDNYSRIFKALGRLYPVFFDSVQLPADWTSFKILLDVLASQEDHNFTFDFDKGQRRRVVAVSIAKFLGHLFIQGIWDPEAFIRDLWHSELAFHLRASCKKGVLLGRLLAPYNRLTVEELELHVECTCELLQVIDGRGLDVLDGSQCFRHKLVEYLTSILEKRNAGGQPFVGKRICFLLQDCLKLIGNSGCLCPKGVDAKSSDAVDVVGIHVAKRIDPSDGKAYTLLELMSF